MKDIDEALDEAQMVSNDQKEVNIPEAPAVSNVKVWIEGYGVTLTVRGEKLNDMIHKTETIIDYAKSHGWKNVWDSTPGDVLTPPKTVEVSVGTCPKCGSPLVEAKKKDGTLYKKCSTNKWNKMTKTASGCDYVDWS